MKKLEDIPKKQVFDVPDDYFDRLPGIIQARVAKPSKETAGSPVFGFALRYALPVILAGAIAIFLFTRQPSASSPEDILASIETADLVAYLETTEFTTEELLDAVFLDVEDAEQIEQAVFGLDIEGDDLSEEELNDILGEMDF